MLFGVGSGRSGALAYALIGLTLSLSPSVAAPRAAELGPTAPLAEPSGGFVGQLRVTPPHGTVGTPITVTGEGFPAGQDLDLVWATVTGSWKVSTAEYFGREYRPAAYRIATVKSDAAGRVAATFVAPDDFGFQHDVIIQQGSRLLTKDAFSIDMTVKVLADNVPVGTPIPIEVQGIGWRELEGSWVMLYDNRFNGWISTVSSRRRPTVRSSRSASPFPMAQRCCRRPHRSRPKRMCAGFRHRASSWRRRNSLELAGRSPSGAQALRPASPSHSTGRPSPATASVATRW